MVISLQHLLQLPGKTWHLFNNYSLTFYIQIPREAQLANTFKIRKDSLRLWVISFILLCKVTFLVKLYWSIHTCYHKYNRKDFCKWTHLCYQHPDEETERDQKSRNPPHHPPQALVPKSNHCPDFLNQFCHFWVVSYTYSIYSWKGLYSFNQINYHLFIIWKENMYCQLTVSDAWYF